MDALLMKLSSIAEAALADKKFDPNRVEELMKEFERESMASLAAMEEQAMQASKDAEASVRKAHASCIKSSMSSTSD
uniref:Uncharacterized protein n=1 Tax=Nymphaea colorata TaxID=210225 RepID=A0A5K0WJP9_9MAGN